jgi:hypothetical protein
MQAQNYSIKTWAENDRPREKLLSKTPDNLTDSELLAILIGQGTREKNAVDLARELLATMDRPERTAATVASQPPPDIRSGVSARAEDRIEPAGVPASHLGPGARALLGQLTALYLSRLPAALAAREATRIAGHEYGRTSEFPNVRGPVPLCFTWPSGSGHESSILMRYLPTAVATTWG